MSESAKLNRKTISAEEYHRRSLLCMETKKKNGTTNTSRYEEDTYKELCLYYGKDDIVWSYSNDERYPFTCDFYIKSLDLFIELNIHPSHGDHSFDSNNTDDVLLLEQLKNKNDEWSNMIIDVWTQRDVRKINYARKNNLKYLCIYADNYNDFILLIRNKKLCELVN